jgi:hypothetical protein
MINLPVKRTFPFSRPGGTDISLHLATQEIQDMPDQKSEGKK